MKQSKGLKLVDILVTVVIAIVFGIIYKLWGPLYNAVQPFGFKAEQLIYGMWFIAGTVAALVIRKPGVALLAELAASSAEFVTGSEWGLSVLISGVLQGLFAEIVFALFLYKRFTMGTACLAAVGSTFGSLIMDYHYGYIEDLAVWNVTTLIVARAVGAVVLAGVLAYVITKALEATGVTQLVRPASAEDYRSLD